MILPCNPLEAPYVVTIYPTINLVNIIGASGLNIVYWGHLRLYIPEE
eukprot:UN31646